MNFIFIFISSSDPNLLQKKTVKQKINKNSGLIALVFFFFVVVFLFSLMSLSRLFHSYRDEPIVMWGETGVPWENHLTHPQAELGLSHVAIVGLVPTPVTAVR